MTDKKQEINKQMNDEKRINDEYYEVYEKWEEYSLQKAKIISKFTNLEEDVQNMYLYKYYHLNPIEFLKQLKKDRLFSYRKV